VPLDEFYTGVRRTVMQPDEMLVDIAFPALSPEQRGMFIKLGLRRAQAIAVVNSTVLLTFGRAITGKLEYPRVLDVKITLGAVAPTIIHAQNAEIYLKDRELNEATISYTAHLAMEASRPIDDVRSSAAYRREMVRVCVSRSLNALWKRQERQGFPDSPILLWGEGQPDRAGSAFESVQHQPGVPIRTRINGEEHVFSSGHGKTLLRLLREEAGLIGTKEGCAEGECGACTVFLDGKAVMSCLVPAERAHDAEIVTVEGLAVGGQLHPVQQAFVDEGAVQCGYCTPGFLMSAAKLLEEQPHPSRGEIAQALTGNLCRCTGYYKIIAAVEKASQMEVDRG
jgi:carbon-monoxide dehydrogenase medium subunit